MRSPWGPAWKQSTISNYVMKKYTQMSKFYETYEVYSLNIREETKERIRKTKRVGKSWPCIFEVRGKDALEYLDKVMRFKVLMK
jgi:hypothetical protein